VALVLAVSLATIAMPAAIVRWIILRERFELATLLALPVIAGIGFTAFLLTTRLTYRYNPGLTPLESLREVATVVLYGLFVLTFLHQLWSSAARRRWWTLAITLGAPLLYMSLLVAIALAALAPSERVLWDGWHVVPLLAVYNMGLLIILWKLARAVGRAFWRGFQWLSFKGKTQRAVTTPPDAALP
jgi:hypothetical protein